MRPTGGKYLSCLSVWTGNAACSRGYSRVQSVLTTAAAVWGALRSGEFSTVKSPLETWSISWRMVIIASMKRSISARSSDSVGSTMRVPATGKDSVGAWKPKSMRRLATSSAVTPVLAVSSRKSRMHSCATRPLSPV